jgi:hypothetical protein
MQLENKYLQIQGIVENDVLHEFIGDRKYTKPDSFWFFVDYAPATYKVNSKFDIILEGEEIKIAPHFYNIKLLTVLDQFGHHLDAIREGWKSVCRFGFTDAIPKAVYSLPVLTTWKYNKNSLKIANHNDIFIEPNIPSKRTYALVFNDLFSYALHTDSINKKDFISYILKIYAANKEELNGKVPSELFKEVEKQLHAIDK